MRGKLLQLLRGDRGDLFAARLAKLGRLRHQFRSGAASPKHVTRIAPSAPCASSGREHRLVSLVDRPQNARTQPLVAEKMAELRARERGD